MIVGENDDEALASLLVAFGYVDGHLHANEKTVIEDACNENGINPQLLSDIFKEYENNCTDYHTACRQALSAITSEDLREKALVILCDIAAADNSFDENEKLFLGLASKEWGIDVAVKPEEIKWDEHQRKVVFAPKDDRLEVHAGPGMGKTAVACGRVSELIEQGVAPTNIWLLSFTRTAVHEIRDRIGFFAADSRSVLGVKIGTIDSRAWRIRCGFTDDEVEKCFGSYDASILEVINIIQNGSREVGEFLESLEHMIIDEAQDITGLRAQLIFSLLNLLPEECGVTIFSDPAQAIYGFSNSSDATEEEKTNLLELTQKNFKKKFHQHELQTIHRTKAPNLIELIEELRLDIYVNDNIDIDAFERRRDIIFQKANKTLEQFDTQELEEYDDALVLFRRRAEVLLASSFACSDGINHRIRMSGMPTVVLPWIAQIFSNYDAKVMDSETFKSLWNNRSHYILSQGTTAEDAWNILLKLSNERGRVSTATIRKKLSRNPPDFIACVPDLGNNGPIISTIHASKGREADQVILRLPVNPNKSITSDLDEESRVLFVGASRAKSSLHVGHGFLRASFSPSLASGRSFLKGRPVGRSQAPSAMVEIGREGDIDPYSFVSRMEHNQATAVKIQRDLAILAEHSPSELEARWNTEKEFQYQIWTKFDGGNPGRAIGYFNQSLNKDLFEILKRITGNSRFYRPPNSLLHFYLLGVSTFVAPEDDPRLSEVHEPFASSGIWLIPVVIGFPSIPFFKRRRWRN